MALQLNLANTDVGVPAPQAYARIAAVHYDVGTNRVDIYVNISYNQAARDAGLAPVGGGVYSGFPGMAPDPAMNPYPMPSLDQALPGLRDAIYTWLKTLPDFAGATDC